LVAVACFLPGRAKDLSAPPRKNKNSNTNKNTNAAVDSDAKGKLTLISLQKSASRCVTLCHSNILKPVALASLLLTYSRVRHVF